MKNRSRKMFLYSGLLISVFIFALLDQKLTAGPGTSYCFFNWSGQEVSCFSPGCDADYQAFMLANNGVPCDTDTFSANFWGCESCGSPGIVSDVQCVCTY